MTNSHGGKRFNSGRKRLAPSEKKQRVSYFLLPDEKEQMDEVFLMLKSKRIKSEEYNEKYYTKCQKCGRDVAITYYVKSVNKRLCFKCREDLNKFK